MNIFLIACFGNFKFRGILYFLKLCPIFVGLKRLDRQLRHLHRERRHPQRRLQPQQLQLRGRGRGPGRSVPITGYR